MFDQISKFLIVRYMNLSESIRIIRNFFYLTYVQNRGSAWNLFYGYRWFLVGLSVLALYVVIKYFLLDEKITKMEKIGYALLIGGISGNLIDRLFRGYVIDFIDVYLLNYNYPVFNIADMAIVIGSIMVVVSLLMEAKK